MRDDWKTFLADAGAVVEDGVTTSFGNPTRERKIINAGGIITDLSHTGLIAVHGDDAQTFLMNQFINDVKQVTDNHCQLNGYCNPKGRLYVIFWLFKRDGVYYLHLPRELIEILLKRLRMYVLNAKVTLEDASDALVHIGFSSPKGVEELGEILGNTHFEINETKQAAGLTILRITGRHPRFIIFGETAEVKKLWAALDVNAAPVGTSPWELLNIQSGIPTILTATLEAFIPQMVNLDVIGGLSFTKGCYPGQEIVARTHYLGKLKRRMVLARATTDKTPVSGDDVYYTLDGEAKKTGTIVLVQVAEDKGFEMLIVLEITSLDRTLTLDGNSGSQITLMELPYSVDTKHREE